MKKINLLLALLITAVSFAQTPQGFNYQATVRDNAGELVANQNVNFKFNVIQGSQNNDPLYSETHQNISTDDLGQVGLVIGEGTATTGVFSEIDWSLGNYFLGIELDTGSGYVAMGITQMLSVPYALYAKNTDSWQVDGDKAFTFKSVGINTDSPSSPLEVLSAPGAFSHGIKLVRSTNVQGKGLPLSYNLFNNANQQFRYANISGGILDDLAGQEKGFISFQVADGTGSWGVDYQQEKMRLTNIGLGIGIKNPQRILHVNDVMRLEPRNASPANPSKGDIYFDNNLNKLRVYDGTTWQNCM